MTIVFTYACETSLYISLQVGGKGLTNLLDVFAGQFGDASRLFDGQSVAKTKLTLVVVAPTPDIARGGQGQCVLCASGNVVDEVWRQYRNLEKNEG